MRSLIEVTRNRFEANETIAENYIGLSTDAKPELPANRNGTKFYEMDTQDAYMYDGENLTWILQ